jgi:four helix bundle protein
MASIIKTKSYLFAIRVVNLNKYLVKEKQEFVMSKQLLKSGTSIAANVREAVNAQSSADFIHKLSISQKEADETLFWLELLNDTEYITEEQFEDIYDDCRQVYKIITSIILTKKQNLKKK